MQLFYTGAVQPNTPQPEASKSLGGFVSSSPVPNGRLNNLFSTISKSTAVNNQPGVRLLVLKNTSGAEVTTIKIYTDVANSHIKLKIAAVAPAVDGCGNTIFESILDGHTIPYQATLDYCEGVDNAVNIASLAIGGCIGIWVCREIDPTKFPALLGVDTNITPQDLAVLIKAQAEATEDVVKLNISWA